MDQPSVPVTNIELSLRGVVRQALEASQRDDVRRLALEVAGDRPNTSIASEVASIMDWVTRVVGFDSSRIVDADEAAFAALMLLLVRGVRCRLVGARFGISWTCWLAYLSDDEEWVTVDPMNVGRVPDRQPDERVEIECGRSLVSRGADDAQPVGRATTLERVAVVAYIRRQARSHRKNDDDADAVLLEVMADRIEGGDHLKSTEEGS